ncbi:MAG: DUF4493 domain-containing protein [Alistipes sp.]|nr:DUF4493 domain-containing protein [Alistipes sp.]
MKRYGIILLAAVVLAACAKDEGGETRAEGYGTLVLAARCANAVTAETRAQAQIPAEDIPTADELGLLVESVDPEYEFSQVWPALSAYDSQNDYLWATHYKLSLFSGTEPVGAGLAPEGIGLPYFEGSETTLVSVGLETTHATVTARLANTAVRLVFTDRFKGYFGNGAEFTLTTDAGTEVGLNYETAEKWCYVRPARFTLSGEATKQTPSATQPAQTVRFAEQVNDDVQPGKLYTYVYDVSGIGDTGEVIILLNDTPVRTETTDEELNDDAKPEEPAN